MNEIYFKKSVWKYICHGFFINIKLRFYGMEFSLKIILKYSVLSTHYPESNQINVILIFPSWHIPLFRLSQTLATIYPNATRILLCNTENQTAQISSSLVNRLWVHDGLSNWFWHSSRDTQINPNIWFPRGKICISI